MTHEPLDERLRRAHAERDELLRRSIAVADEERRRIAGQLHDEAIQSLTAALLRVDLAQQRGGADTLDEIRAPLHAAIEALQRTILALAPPDLPEAGLQAAVETFLERSGIDRAVTVQLRIDEPAADESVLLATSRTVQEALTNVHRHAGATSAEVAVWQEGGRIHGRVVGDGVGPPAHLDLDQASGLRLLRDRLRVLGGELDLAPAHGARGTRVRWSLPLRPGG